MVLHAPRAARIVLFVLRMKLLAASALALLLSLVGCVDEPDVEPPRPTESSEEGDEETDPELAINPDLDGETPTCGAREKADGTCVPQ